jgi:hypothetical protein
MKYVILDLDNCISDDGWRVGYIDKNRPAHHRYRKYHLLAGFDEPHNKHLFKPEEGHQNIILTARPNEYRDIAVEWLMRHGVQYRFLLMRPENDFRPAAEAKLNMLLNLNSLYGMPTSDIVAAYDDNMSIIEMYRREGISATQLKIHEVQV